MFHRQVFEDLRRSTPHCQDPAEGIAIGAVEASFKILASAMIVLTGSGRYEDSHKKDIALLLFEILSNKLKVGQVRS